MRSVVYLSYDGLTDALGQSQILPYLQGLAREGYHITIVSFEKRDKFENDKGNIGKTCNDHNITWEPLPYHKSPPVLSTVYDLFVLARVVKKLLSTQQTDIVHCRSYLMALIGLWAKRKFGVRFIFDMRGFWADERIDGGLWRLRSPLGWLMYRFFKWKEKQFIKEADHVVCLTENALNEIRLWGLKLPPVSVIPTCVDMRLFDPSAVAAESQRLRETLSVSKDEFVLAYLGSWGTWYMTDKVLDFFSILAEHRPDSRLLILTPDRPDLGKYLLASKTIVRSVPRKDVPAYLSIADASICFIKPSYSKKASSATKVAEAWAMNLPVVTNPGWGDIDKLNEEGRGLLVCDPTTALKAIVTRLVDMEKKDLRGRLVGTFDLESGIQKYSSIYRTLGWL